MSPEDAALVARLREVAKSGGNYNAANIAALRIEALAAEVERLRIEVGEWKLLTESAEYKLGQERARCWIEKECRIALANRLCAREAK